MLTAKQEEFAKKIVEGMNQSDAYRSAYNTKRMTDKSIWESASKLINDTKVATRIAQLREQLADESILTAKQRLQKLSRLAEESEDPNVQMKAIDLMNKMTGEYVQKIAAEVQTETTINIELVDDDE